MIKQIVAELEFQKQQEGATENIRLIEIILEHVVTNREWSALVSVQHHRYGTLSYETSRFYYVRQWVMRLFEDVAKQKKDGERLNRIQLVWDGDQSQWS